MTMKNRFLKFLLLLACCFYPTQTSANELEQKEFIRLTGGPVFYDELSGSQLNKEKWELWPIEFDDKKYFSYRTNVDGLTLQAKKNCFNGFNFYGVVSKPIRGLTDIALVAEVDVPNEAKYLPAIIHLCNCCSEFSDLEQDDFWCDVNIDKGKDLFFICNEVKEYNKLLPKSKSIINRYKIGSKKNFEKYLVKITHSHPSYKISGYIRAFEKKSTYELIGSTTHPYPFSQGKVELKTYTINCDEKSVLKEPARIATFKNVRVYKNPNRNPLFIRVVGKSGKGVIDYKVKLTTKDIHATNLTTTGITDQEGYATLNLSQLSVQEYPIFNYNIQIFNPASLIPLPSFSKDFTAISLKNGIYPGDFWQVYCKNCD